MFSTAFLDVPALQSAHGTVTLPGSKSISNRVLLLAALCQGTTTLHDLLDSDDTRVMLNALRAMGCAVEVVAAQCRSPAWAGCRLRLRWICSWATPAPPCARSPLPWR